jgi:thioredoxin-related protein
MTLLIKNLAAALCSAFLLSVAHTSMAANAPSAPERLPPGIAWEQGDVNAAFAKAKASNKPLFLYWGAVWCPPCNQVKATIFTQQAFKERSTFFVPVFLDGDSESAQKLGERFKVKGYPTMILFRPDGTEITRLPGESDPARYMEALSLGMNATHSFKQTLASALQDNAKLSADEWRTLADYSWDVDASLPMANDQLATTLQTLARHARANHAPNEALRFELKAVTSMGSATPPQHGAIDKALALQATQTVLASQSLSRSNFDVIADSPAEVTTYLSAPGTSQRTQLAKQWDAALTTLMTDPSLSTTDRLSALYGRVDLAKLDTPKGAPLPQALLDTVQQQVALADKNTSNPYERQSVIDEAAETLTDAGLLDQSDTVLKAELKRSPAPYYFMSGLARNAKARGDKAGTLAWYKQAYDASKGPATRLRWGVTYISNVMELSPGDDTRVQTIAADMLDQLGETHDAFYGRNRKSLETMVSNLGKWDQGNAHRATVNKVVMQFEGVCGKLPASDPQHATCEDLIKPVKA